MKTNIRIFISSPGDVQEEREKARRVVAELQRTFEDQAVLPAVLWEDLPIPATASFQEGIDLVLSERHRIEIAVFLISSGLGSALGASIRKADGSPYCSGTEREFNLMLHAFEQGGRQLPLILAYTRRDEDAFNERLDARKLGDDSLEEILRQRKLSRRFIRANFLDAEGRNFRAYHSYREPVGFAQRLLVQLRDAIGDSLSFDAAADVWDREPGHTAPTSTPTCRIN